MKKYPIFLCFIVVLLSSLPVCAGELSGHLSYSGSKSWEDYRPGYWNEMHPSYPGKILLDPPEAKLLLKRMDKPISFETSKAEVTLKGLKFNPAISVVRGGATVVFINDSPYVMTVIPRGEGVTMPMTILPNGGKAELTTSIAGVIELLVEEFSHMKGHILVVNQGQVIDLDADRHFSLNDLEPGAYSLSLWAGRWFEGEPFELDPSEHTMLSMRLGLSKCQAVGLHIEKSIKAVDADKAAFFLPEEFMLMIDDGSVSPKQPASPSSMQTPMPSRTVAPKSKAKPPVIRPRSQKPRTVPAKPAARPKAESRSGQSSNDGSSESDVKKKPAKSKKKKSIFKIKVID